MNLKYLKEGEMQRLKNAVSRLKDYYINDEVWIDEYFEEDQWLFSSRINVESFDLSIPNNENNYDLENTKQIYRSLKSLKPYQATEERIWAYLSHKKCWEYMRKRWPAENYLDGKDIKFRRNIHKRYFLSSKSKRALLRNGISRLWWFGYITYQEGENNPFRLTEIMLSKQDIAANITERNFSNNPKITKSLLTVLKNRENIGLKLPNRKVIREICKYLSHLGGVSLIDSLSRNELEGKIEDRINYLEKTSYKL